MTLLITGMYEANAQKLLYMHFYLALDEHPLAFSFILLLFSYEQVKWVRESDKIARERRDRIDEIAGANYNKERDYREQVRQKELARTLLVAGSLATLLVSNVCKLFGKGVVGVKGIPVVVQNVWGDGSHYTVKALGALLKGKFRRKDLILVQNEKLRSEIEMSSLNTIEEVEVREYIQSSMMPRSVTPTCDCRGGCKTQSCPCRVAGFTCGAHCHKAYYTRHRTCANYK